MKSNIHFQNDPFSVKAAAAIAEKKRKVLVISGPTGVGKTALSLKLASVMGGEIVSADSMQVYRGMDIGTAKVGLEERREIRHHLIDSRDINEPFNVVDFHHEAKQAFEEIFSRDHVPIVVGGTGFYIHSLIYGPPQGPPPCIQIRSQIEAQIQAKGALAVYEELKKQDPVYAASITAYDTHKIVRGLEIILLTGKTVSSFGKQKSLEIDLDFFCWFLYKPKEILYPIVDQRCEMMIENGLIDEVRQLKELGLEENTSACQAIGYRQMLSYLHSLQTLEELNLCVEDFKRATRRYVKRQFTWFKKEPLFRWLNLQQYPIDTALELIIQDYEKTV